MMAGIGRRGRAALCGAAIAGVAAGAGVSGRLPEAHALVFALLWLEAVICGAAAGASTAGWYGREGVYGSVRAFWGGAVAAAMGLALFGGGAGLWLKAADGTAVVGLTDMAWAFPVLAVVAGFLLHGLELMALRKAALEDAESL
jgi:hypothetical protein